MVKPVVYRCRRNPRDLGGYVGYQDSKVKMHRLIRSGKIAISPQMKSFCLIMV